MPALPAEQLARIEENRAKARERLAARAEAKAQEAANRDAEFATSGPSGPELNLRDASRKRPYDSIKPAKKFTNYIEYDLSKIKDSKGGFMPDDDTNQLPDGMTLEEWKQKQQRIVIEPQRAINPDDNPKCFECQSFDIDFELFKVFKCRVCRACKAKFPEKYSLLTKTECREDYLLTDPELRDDELMPHLERPNPHKTTYNNMMLYLRYQVEEFAFKKWAGAEGLDKEFERRVALRKEKKDRKFADKLKQMRKRTRTETWNKRLDRPEHRHTWGPETRLPNKGVSIRKCTECGIESEEILF
ncbi:XPA protein C-terminus-domain-containing protein [Lipomyces tetrasporus]|uniref:DNA repair protein RAD14 n=1 Tax=Lipomyces tetrasporus TaxID=54092 RepID=A0AAD7VWQ7_9ASCO|nr:XPA protein C-terminus-domain-containing protein [Lipomyces tetrasporus]KAJ8104304.1 XPA protein C-terminus-domain-containing protein [Lipomyces tetrasporus]